MAASPQPAALSVLSSQPTTVFEGLWQAVRHREPLMGAVSFSGILSRFLPLLLASVPFTAAQTFLAHEVCTWGAIVVLIIMVPTLFANMWLNVSKPHLPVSPDSLAGVAYYVCDSAMLRDFERLSMLEARERDRKIERMSRKYSFGWMMGVSGKRRIGIDYAHGERSFEMKSLWALGLGVTAGRARRK